MPGQNMDRPIVLIVDDNEGDRFLVATFLEKIGLKNRQTASADEALTVLAQGQECSLVIMDLLMPGMNGLECARQIRQMEAEVGNRIPIIGITGYAGEDGRDECLAAGMDDYLIKPVTVEQLQIMTRLWLPA